MIVQINKAKPQRNSKVSYAGETLPAAFTSGLGLSSHFSIPPDPEGGSFRPYRSQAGVGPGEQPEVGAVQGLSPLCAQRCSMVVVMPPPQPCIHWA